jgi:protein-disulfide isomerase
LRRIPSPPLRDNEFVRIRYLAIALFFGVVALAEGPSNWQTAPEYPGVDWHGISGARKQAAMKFIREEQCTCGCQMKIAECRMKDPGCGYSRKLASVAMKSFAEGKTVTQVRADVKKAASEPPPTFEEPVQISLAGDPSKGPDNAKVTIVEFSDFQCPFCQKAIAEAYQVLRTFPKDVRLVFKQFPLDSHADAEFGAEAALSAQAQGKFWEMHDLMYGGFPDLSRKTVFGYARKLNLNMQQFTADMDSHKYRNRVQMEEKQGEDASVGGTPTFFINGKKYNGIFDVATVAPLIKKELTNR